MVKAKEQRGGGDEKAGNRHVYLPDIHNAYQYAMCNE